jgi:hypothetical protein
MDLGCNDISKLGKPLGCFTAQPLRVAMLVNSKPQPGPEKDKVRTQLQLLEGVWCELNLNEGKLNLVLLLELAAHQPTHSDQA